MGAAAVALAQRAQARAAREPAFAAVLEAILDAPTTAAGELTRVAARNVNDGRRQQSLADFRAGALSTAEVQHRLGRSSAQSVHVLRSRKQLLGRTLGNATWFPAWQFSDGRIRSDLPEIIQTLHRFTADSIAADRVMRLRRDELGGRSIAEALDRKRIAATARAILADLGS